MTKKYNFEMTKRFTHSICIFLLSLFISGIGSLPATAQDAGINIKGVVLESGTGLPLKQVSISVKTTGKSTDTDEKGAFSILVPDNQVELIIYLPGYTKRNVFLNGRNFLNISLVADGYKSLDNLYNKPLGTGILKDENYAITSIKADEMKLSIATSFDQSLQGKVPGLSVIQQSGMPGHKTFMNIRGISSLYGKTEPLLFIDGMIHDYTYATEGLMEGFSLNPMEIVDIDDIADISVLKDGASFLGAAGSNGVINVNTEQKSETSTVIKFSAYGGISLTPASQDVMDASQFKGYFSEMLNSRGYTTSQINGMYPWLNGSSGVADYYKYNNNTDWQNATFKPATLSKYHFFLKGGDDIATYNISTGYLLHKGLYEESKYSRFNLRINGKINISDKFSITPNVKLSLADSYLPNQGPSVWKNPVSTSLLAPPIMGEFARDNRTGTKLSYLDDIGVFNVSNPAALVTNAIGTNRNYHFLSSVNAQYKFSERLVLSNLLGIDFNNSRENIFMPNVGVIQLDTDSASNSPGDFVNEFRSSQNHSSLAYNNQSANGHSINLNVGFRYLKNSYKFDKAIDLNTPSDDFKSLGQGSKYIFLRRSTGDVRGLLWVSYYGNAAYNFRNKYFINGMVSYDGNSAVNSTNRFSIYPSLSAAWRLSSESFLSDANWLDDLKLRASYSITGNMFSSIYDYSKLYYTSQRFNNNGVIVREAIPNDNLELEKKSTINVGFDLSIIKQAVNIHFDYYQSKVNNLIIQQELPASFGYTNYFDNGGKLGTSGIEIAADTRIQKGSLVWTFGAAISKQVTEVTSLSFLNPDHSSIVTNIDGGQFITSVGNAVNAYYGFETNGIYASDADAGQMIGPKGVPMKAGDIKFVDHDNNKVINEADKMIIGDPNPALYGGFNTSLSYKNFEINALFNYSVGNDIFNYVRYKAESMDTYSNQLATVLDRWTTNNTSATLPRASFGDPTGNTVFSDRWIEDGSYLRLKQLTVSYNLPGITGVYKGISIYLTGTNLFTFTKYTGYDPDFLYSNNPFYMGVDYGKIPQPKSIVLGLKLDL